MNRTKKTKLRLLQVAVLMIVVCAMVLPYLNNASDGLKKSGFNLFGVHARATLTQDGDTVNGLDNTWMWSSNNDSDSTKDSYDLWYTAASGQKFGGGQTVRFATKTGGQAQWADAPLWVERDANQNYNSPDIRVYNGKLYKCNWWIGGNVKPDSDAAWAVLMDTKPTADYTFTFDKKSDQEILDYLDKERARLASKKKVMAYLPSWGAYDGHNKFDASTIDYSGVTHLTYSFMKPIDKDKSDPKWIAGTEGIKQEVQGQDNITNATTNFAIRWDDPEVALLGGSWIGGGGAIVPLVQKEMAKYPDKYFVFSVGGWTYGENGEFEKATSTPARREQFATAIVDYMVKFKFDGIDMDWEFPVGATYQNQFLELMKLLRQKMTQVSLTTEKYYQLSAATTPNKNNIQYISPAELAKICDTVNYMAYDYYGGSFGADPVGTGTLTNHNAPLYESIAGGSEADFYIDVVTKEYLKQGVPANQLLLGIPFYGRSWGQVASTQVVQGFPGLGVNGRALTADGTPTPGGGLWGNSTTGYYEVDQLVAPGGGFTRYWDDKAKVPYAYNANTQRYISYDDVESVGIKMQYIIGNGLAGTIIWDITGDTRTDLSSDKIPYKLGSVLRPLVGMDNAAGDDANITTLTLPDVEVGTEYSSIAGTKINATGKGTIKWQLSSVTNAGWLSIDANGQLKGVSPSTAQNVSFTVTATSDTNKPQSQTYNIKVLAKQEPPVITTTSLPNGQVARSYAASLAATGAGSSPKWELANNGTVSWLIINQSTGALSGTPTTAGTFNFDIKVTNQTNNLVATKAFSIQVTDEDIVITTGILPDGKVNSEYSASVQATGVGSNPKWELINNGTGFLQINQTTGALSGRPIRDGDFSIDIKVTNQTNSKSATKTFSLKILSEDAKSPPSITTINLPNAKVGVAYNFTVEATGIAPIAFELIDNTASWLSIEPNGTLKGTPIVEGNVVVKVKATNPDGVANQDYTLTVEKADVITPPTDPEFDPNLNENLANATVDVVYNQVIDILGVMTGDMRITLVEGRLPQGLTFNLNQNRTKLTIAGFAIDIKQTSFKLGIEKITSDTGTRVISSKAFKINVLANPNAQGESNNIGTIIIIIAVVLAVNAIAVVSVAFLLKSKSKQVAMRSRAGNAVPRHYGQGNGNQNRYNPNSRGNRI